MNKISHYPFPLLLFFNNLSGIRSRYFHHPTHLLAFLFLFCALAPLQREFDENEVDPYHGQQDKRPEPEAMDLPEDLNLDQDDEAGDDGEGQGDGETCR